MVCLGHSHSFFIYHACSELECIDSFSGVKVGVESLPRSETSLFSVKLGGLFLRDLTTQGSIFPVLVSPKPVSNNRSVKAYTVGASE